MKMEESWYQEGKEEEEGTRLGEGRNVEGASIVGKVEFCKAIQGGG